MPDFIDTIIYGRVLEGSTMPSNHVFNVLKQERNEIRLLHLDPVKKSSFTSLHTLTGRLQCVSLLDAPRYNALSYVWGNPIATSAVFLDDGSYVPVAANLLDALCHIPSIGLTAVGRSGTIDTPVDDYSCRYGWTRCASIRPVMLRRAGKSR